MSGQKRFEIVCSEELLGKIEEHCFSSTKTEVVGFLVGTVSEGKSTVTHVLKAKHTANTQSQLTFTNKTWETAFAEMSEISGDAQLIGWFHSHPNFGVFLSDYDKFIQNEFFNKDGMITIVVDPINGKRGWFISLDKEVRPYAEEENTSLEKLGLEKGSGDSKNQRDFGVEMKSSSGANGVSIGRTIAIAGVFSLFSLLANFAISGGQSGNIDKEGLQQQIYVLQQKVIELQLQLNPEDLNQGVEPEVTPSAAASKSPTAKKSATPSKTSKKSTSPTKAIAGTTCPKENSPRAAGGKTYVCAKIDNKLVWRETSKASKSSTTSPSASQSPSSPSQPSPTKQTPTAEPTPQPTNS